MITAESYLDGIGEAEVAGRIVRHMEIGKDLWSHLSRRFDTPNMRLLNPVGEQILKVLSRRKDPTVLITGPGAGVEPSHVSVIAQKANRNVAIHTLGLTAFNDHMRFLIPSFSEIDMEPNLATLRQADGLSLKQIIEQHERSSIFELLDAPFVIKQHIVGIRHAVKTTLDLQLKADFIYDFAGAIFHGFRDADLQEALFSFLNNHRSNDEGVVFIPFIEEKRRAAACNFFRKNGDFVLDIPNFNPDFLLSFGILAARPDSTIARVLEPVASTFNERAARPTSSSKNPIFLVAEALCAA